MIGNTFKHKDNCHSIKAHTGGRLYSCSCCLDERKTLERLARENAMLHERTKPNTVVLIGNTGHYVNDAVAQHIDQLRQKADMIDILVRVLDDARAMTTTGGLK